MSNGFFNSSSLNDLMGTVGNYYLGKEGIEGAYETGKLGQQMSSELAEDLSTRSSFQPFTVTSRTGVAKVNPSGNVDIQPDVDSIIFQEKLQKDAEDLFGRLGSEQGIQERTSQVYDDIRRTQTPEEQRQRLAMEERLLGQGRLGLQSSMFGGANPEMFGLEQARQEAMNRAALAARDVASKERQADYALASGLLGQSFVPDEEMRKVLAAGLAPKQLQQQAQLQGTTLYGQAQGRGVESLLQGADLANRLQLQQQQAMMDAFIRPAPSMDDILRAQALGIDASTLGGDEGLFSALGFGESSTPQWIKDIGDGALRWLGIGQEEEPDEDDAVSQLIQDPSQFDNYA